MSGLGTIGEQATYWEIAVPADFVSEFSRVTFGKYRQTVNVWQWDVVRRAFYMPWSWVALWVRVGYPEPPRWIVLQAVSELINERARRQPAEATRYPTAEEVAEGGRTDSLPKPTVRRPQPHWRTDGGP